MSMQTSNSHSRLVIMPENWEEFKDIIKELYITQNYTLDALRAKMSIEHGINAS
jgi:Clr5 domain